MAAGGPVQAQDPSVLYAGLIKTRGYVVGSPLSAGGLHRFDGDTTWTHLGWNHPRVIGISQDPNDPDVLFLACGNGVLRTLDGGASWRLTTDWRVNEGLDVAVDPNAPEHVYLATAFGVWRTTDRGDTWMEAGHGLRGTFTRTIEVDRTQTGRVLAGTWSGLYLSIDGARTWMPVGPEDVPILDVQQTPTTPSVWIAATQDRGVMRSDDGGQTWRFARGSLADKTVHAVAIDPFDPARMAAAGWDTGVYVSTNGGRSWTQRKRGLPTPHFYEVIFDANVPGRLWAATIEKGVFFSDDEGRTWETGGLHGTLVFDMVFLNPMTP
ncbi:MAG: WD40/YVTN/BNR-like repeat-containing protein [Rhodothermales bacterium]